MPQSSDPQTLGLSVSYRPDTLPGSIGTEPRHARVARRTGPPRPAHTMFSASPSPRSRGQPGARRPAPSAPPRHLGSAWICGSGSAERFSTGGLVHLSESPARRPPHPACLFLEWGAAAGRGANRNRNGDTPGARLVAGGRWQVVGGRKEAACFRLMIEREISRRRAARRRRRERESEREDGTVHRRVPLPSRVTV
ncbi:hypothetical protein CC85DRAFT_198190 [Cutaneotrichosporon oleaginosum]|uniref:Uncharacterized protein n=1 Tax=Cutaneotrichosporon oleaginosum TaxID=879819 RepID=A0A0J0XE02_9TREE|nr:uncharacterized protein CC85DRAFT_198190 [Cutaneotrichosporon oleaginosum]KLT39335.1 hypothetical protein CC85DRAFT_198190 [Cutaneotrichosporon oleaginosum]TXT08531.1 hypothetical protein COLE_05455 [Cutaneotrichosporon oleaginosum]